MFITQLLLILNIKAKDKLFRLGFTSVDINTADVKALTTLKGVGEKKAEAIVTYRKAHGCFETVNALAKVKGIGVKTVTANKKELKAFPCKK